MTHKRRLYETKTVMELQNGITYYQQRLATLPPNSARAKKARQMIANFEEALPIARAREDAAVKAGRR